MVTLKMVCCVAVANETKVMCGFVMNHFNVLLIHFLAHKSFTYRVANWRLWIDVCECETVRVPPHE